MARTKTGGRRRFTGKKPPSIRWRPINHTERFLQKVLWVVLGLAVIQMFGMAVVGCNHHDRSMAGDPFHTLMWARYDPDNTKKDTNQQRNALSRHARLFETFLKDERVPPYHSWPTIVTTEKTLDDVAPLCDWPRGSGVTGCAYYRTNDRDPARVVVWAGTHNECPAYFHELAHVNSEALGIDDNHRHPLWTKIDRMGNELSAKIRAARSSG